ncbi:glycoside hydrolase family 24 protein [Pseudomonas sp. HK3]
MFYNNKVKFDENDIDEGLLETVHCPNQTIKSGDLLGYPGVNFSQNNSLHFEIFTDDSIVEFIKDHDNLEASDKTILQVNKGSKLFQRLKVNVPKSTASIDKHSRITIEDTDADSEYVKITAVGSAGVVKKVDMEDYDSDSSKYKGIKANLEQYQSKISSDLAADSRLEFIYYSNAVGDIKTSDTSDGHRLVAFPIADAAQKTYWVKRDLINSQEITTDGVDKGTILFNSLNMLYEQNPDAFTFQDESALGSSDEALVDLTSCKSCKDSDGETWYEVRLPFDDKGLWHYLSLLNGVNRTAQEKGWIKASDTELTSPLNWPGFKLAKENPAVSEGSADTTKDARIDYQNLTPYFKELFEDIDISGNGAISAREMKAALKDSVLADRLSRVIAKHPSEWQSDDTCSKWTHLKELVPDDAAFEEAKKQITNLAWWDKAKAAGASLPDSPEVYHLHPVSYLEQVNIIQKIENIAVEARIRAFLRMIRVGEGTIGSRGYETLFGGGSFIKDHNKDWSKHPDIHIPFNDTTSTAAGAYQILKNTWEWISGKHPISNFSAINQDIAAVAILKYKVWGSKSRNVLFFNASTGERMNALSLIVENRIKDAIEISSLEWASLPPGRYGQPIHSYDQVISYYEKYFKEELEGRSDLVISRNKIMELFF